MWRKFVRYDDSGGSAWKKFTAYITSKPNIGEFFFILLASCSHFPPLSISILCLFYLFACIS